MALGVNFPNHHCCAPASLFLSGTPETITNAADSAAAALETRTANQLLRAWNCEPIVAAYQELKVIEMAKYEPYFSINKRKHLRLPSKSNPAGVVAVAPSLEIEQQAVKAATDAICVQSQGKGCDCQEDSPDGFFLLRPARDSGERILDFELVNTTQQANRCWRANRGISEDNACSRTIRQSGSR